MKKTFNYLLLALLIVMIALMSGCTTQGKVLKYMDNNKSFKVKYLAENCEVDTLTEYIKGKDSIIVKEIEVKGDSVLCPPVTLPSGEILPPVRVKCPDQVVKYNEVLRIDTVVRQVENTSKLRGAELLLEDERKLSYLLKWACGVLLLAVIAIFIFRK